MWNWKDAVISQTQPLVVEDVDPFVVVDGTKDGSMTFVSEAWIPYWNEKDRPGWKGDKHDSDTDTNLDSEDDDDMTIVGEDFSHERNKEPYIIIHRSELHEDSNLLQKLASIELSPGCPKIQEIHNLGSKISR